MIEGENSFSTCIGYGLLKKGARMKSPGRRPKRIGEG
ncbi:hypothetical protein COLO4_29014 [Corchorus olitorius]|uniref:Uncharacterized protein n=1 Tax=Corchorus olitorius TaxID=93759 RepID=A0A1R3HGQ1_9ROSI|nr:hypothetical protein COLO4_29014 [Corchorus olitorius]